MTLLSFFITAPKNVEALLAEELQQLGLDNARPTRGGVIVQGQLAEAYRICLWSRLANRVLLEIARFSANSPETLYQGIYQIPWQSHFNVDHTFAVDFKSTRAAITHSQYGALKAKDAIVDQFREQTGQRPSVQTERPDIQLNVYLYRDEATVSLDLSGESLHRRGYREAGAAAPLKENLAAAILYRAGWPAIARQGGAFVDPMCGSGTLPIEAALLAGDIAPGLTRDYWGFSHWLQHQPDDWQALLEEARQRREAGLQQLPDIRGYDINPSTVTIALNNVARAGLSGQVHIEKRELSQARPVHDNQTGLLVINPPYGERLGKDTDLQQLYARLGTTLKQHFSGWQASLFTGNPEMSRQLQLHSQHRYTLFNGPIECRLFNYQIDPSQFVSPRRQPRPLAAAEFTEQAHMLRNRLLKNQKHLARWLQREGIHCYRLYDADIPEYALAIDVYEGEQRWVVVQEYAAPKTVDAHKAGQRLREALGVVLEVLAIPEQQLYFKVRQSQKGTAQYEKLADSQQFHIVREDACQFYVNFADYLDTGLFLDHRITRQMIAGLCPGKRFLNLFAYTGTATVYAAKGQARATTTVDMSRTYLDWAKRNMALNQFSGPQHEFIQANCLDWLDENSQRRYDVIFLDPPSFSTSKRMQGTLDIQRDHVSLLRRALKLLAPDGMLLFSNNLRKFRLDEAALSDLTIRDISRLTLPKDFERNPRIHHCWEIRRPA